MRTTWFLGWGVVGALAALGLLALLSIGIVLLLVAALLAGVLVLGGSRADHGSRGVPGLISGAGFPLLYVAYRNSAGPGTICEAFAGGERCEQQWSPVPFVVSGVLLVLAGLVLFWFVEHRQQRSPAQFLG